MRGSLRPGAGAVAAAAAAILAIWTSLAAACASASSHPTPPPRPADDPILTRLTELLKLDAAQQERTRLLLQELFDRNSKIREKWDRGSRVRPEELLASRGLFERDFVALLTEEQRRVFAEERMKVQVKGGRFTGRSP